MESLWPWLAVAGLGALHGLNPANGWMFAAAWAARDGARTLSALAPIALGHVASIAMVVVAVAQGVLVDRMLVQRLAGALLVAWAAYGWWRNAGSDAVKPQVADVHMPLHARHAGLAFWSCLMATMHGAGLMLVPALVPLCMSDTPARAITASGSLLLALIAVGVHMVAMLVTTGVIASGVCRGIRLQSRRVNGVALRHVWTAVLGGTGVVLMILS